MHPIDIVYVCLKRPIRGKIYIKKINYSTNTWKEISRKEKAVTDLI